MELKYFKINEAVLCNSLEEFKSVVELYNLGVDLGFYHKTNGQLIYPAENCYGNLKYAQENGYKIYHFNEILVKAEPIYEIY